MDLCESGIKPILTYHLINFFKKRKKCVNNKAHILVWVRSLLLRFLPHIKSKQRKSGDNVQNQRLMKLFMTIEPN